MSGLAVRLPPSRLRRARRCQGYAVRSTSTRANGSPILAPTHPRTLPPRFLRQHHGRAARIIIGRKNGLAPHALPPVLRYAARITPT